MSPNDRFGLDHILDDLRLPGRAELAAVIRSVTAAAEPDLAASLPDEAFFEPRLFCQLSNPGVFELMPGPQLTMAWAPADPRPVAVRTDGAGVAVVPGIGLLRIDRPGAEVSADYVPTTAELYCDGGEFTHALFASDSGIEVVRHIDPVLAAFLSEHVEAVESLEIVHPDTFASHLARAVELIAAADEPYYRALCESVRGMVVFTHPDAESFAALGMHGMIFVNAVPGSSVDLFVEHLVHQGGHVLFSEATLHRADFFAIEPDAELAYLDAGFGNRTAYNFLHGLFTEHMECRILVDILSGGQAGPEEIVAFDAHLAHVADRHERDLRIVANHAPKVFSEAGMRLFDGFSDYYAAHVEPARAVAGSSR